MTSKCFVFGLLHQIPSLHNGCWMLKSLGRTISHPRCRPFYINNSEKWGKCQFVRSCLPFFVLTEETLLCVFRAISEQCNCIRVRGQMGTQQRKGRGNKKFQLHPPPHPFISKGNKFSTLDWTLITITWDTNTLPGVVFHRTAALHVSDTAAWAFSPPQGHWQLIQNHQDIWWGGTGKAARHKIKCSLPFSKEGHVSATLEYLTWYEAK